jgi:hypothetical protein
LRTLEKTARESKEAREHAIACIGNSRCGRTAVACLERLTKTVGMHPETLVAVYNLHHYTGLSLACRGLAEADPEVLSYAMMAVCNCLERASLRQRRKERPLLRKRILEVVDRKVAREARADPWLSTLAWGMEALAMLRAPELPSLARQVMRQSRSASARDGARQTLRMLRRRKVR